MNILLDIFGSSFIGGLILLMVLNFNAFQSNTLFGSDADLQLQQNAKTLAEILNYDLRKIGYEYDGTTISEADSERISFYTDIDRNGSPDSVTYVLSDTSAASETTNPEDKVLLRIVDNDTIKGPSLGLTKAKFSYFNSTWGETVNPTEIKYIKAELWVESIEPVDGEYLFTYWEMTINPRNL